MAENSLITRPVLGRAERGRKRIAIIGMAALAALAIAGCSSTPEKEPATTVTVTPAAEPTGEAPAPKAPASTAQPTPAPTITVAPAPVTVTVTPPPAAPPSPVVNEISGPFQSPSGNIRCNLFTATDGSDTALCSVAEKDWLGPMPEGCGANWGNRIDLEAGSPARFGCYGQDLPAATHTLQYGQIQQHGSISCNSETVGIMCIDNDSGHFFRISREEYQIG